MNLFKHSLIITCLSTSLLLTSASQAKQAEVELIHWWNQPGEIDGLNVIKRAVEARGAKFIETRVPSWEKLRSSIISRITSGYAPAATQWLVDEDIFELRSINALEPLPTVLNGNAIKDILLDEVYREVTSKDELLSLPVGIHIQNHTLYNTKIYTELSLPLPTSWEQVLAQAPLIKQAGYVPLAVSNELWQFDILFNAIMMEQLGFARFQQLYQKHQSMKHLREPFIKSMSIFRKLKTLSDPEQPYRDWARSARMVGKQQAAMQVMGDFAKAELTNMDLTAGKEFLCSLSPGSNGNMIYAIDSFMMLNVDEPHLQQGQKILLDAALDNEVQIHYSLKKGSIPVTKVAPDKLDVCSRKSYQLWLNTEKKINTFLGVSNPLRSSFFQTMLNKAWYQNDMTSAQLIDELIEIDESTLKTKHRRQGRASLH